MAGRRSGGFVTPTHSSKERIGQHAECTPKVQAVNSYFVQYLRFDFKCAGLLLRIRSNGCRVGDMENDKPSGKGTALLLCCYPDGDKKAT